MGFCPSEGHSKGVGKREVSLNKPAVLSRSQGHGKYLTRLNLKNYFGI